LTAGGEQRWFLDLSAANTLQLVAAGVSKRRIEPSGLCTSCQYDLFYSHRASNGTTGRFAVVAMLTNANSMQVARVAETASDQGATGPEFHGLDGLDSLDPPGLPSFGELPGGEL
jgi:hypothetical protein